MKKLNKDTSIMKNTVEAYLCASCSFCSCPACECPDGGQASIQYGILAVPASYASVNVRQF